MSDAQQHDNMVSLRHYIEALFEQYQKHHAREHVLLAESIDLARKTMDIRLESMNEFRAQILSERATMVKRDTFDEHSAADERRIGKLEAELANLRGRMAATAASISVGLIVLQLILRFLVKL